MVGYSKMHMIIYYKTASHLRNCSDIMILMHMEQSTLLVWAASIRPVLLMKQGHVLYKPKLI